jgi:Putative DNA-binding domain
VTLLDDLVPERIQAWDAALLNRLRTEDKGETLFFEFKETFDCESIEKAVCAFANRLGGFLVLGVTARPVDNTIDRYPGLEKGVDWLRRMSDCVVGHVSPLPSWDTVQIPSPDDPNRNVIVTRIEASSLTPHVLARNGRIYLRSPAGSDPVTDKATIDSLVARGIGGSRLASHRADSIHAARPGAELLMTPGGTSFVIQVLSEPWPALPEDALMNLLSTTGRAGAGTVFAHPAVRGLAPKGHREDRVLLVAGPKAAARYTDGTVFVQEVSIASYLGVRVFSELLKGVLEASRDQIPTAHQVRLDVRIIGAASIRLDEDGSGATPSSRPLSTDLWQWALLTGTDDVARERCAASFGRRLWRAVGDVRGLEPEI